MKSNYTHIAIVLDRSGSMQTCAHDTMGGFNAFIDDQKKVPGEATLTLAQFDDQYEVVHAAVPLKNIPPLVFSPRGSTALLDAIGKTIIDTGKWLESKSDADRPDKVICVILTDGFENASREFSKEKIFEMIRHQESQYQWQFVFIGANQDAIATAAGIGIHAMSSLTMDSHNVKNAFASTSGAMRATRTRGIPMAYSKADRQANKPKA